MLFWIIPGLPEIYGLPKEPKLPLSAGAEANIFRLYAWIIPGEVVAGLAINLPIAHKRELGKEDKNRIHIIERYTLSVRCSHRTDNVVL